MKLGRGGRRAVPGCGRERPEQVGALLPVIIDGTAEDVDSGRYSGEVNPITSAVSSMAHIVHTSEAHGIDASVMRVAEGLARRVIAQGHGGDDFLRIVEVLNPRGTLE
ncbi:hypothetical protein ITP53_39965 [Nonomuraea sp. K274]|uniref:NADPH-dependent reductive aminase-like C-terminal domain-containing protein n=1 Tax=Nonomuraea cypriaca TaxID=1187855 RepID=A0A931F560_9ACTN|nr:hypothetical protein [Nonomuraea cypriaca]